MRKKIRTLLILSLLIVLGASLHFYNLNWGAPYYFHPDERNIASAVNQLHFSSQMNPHFFAYGSLPIYTIYFTGIAANYLSQWINQTPPASLQTVTFEQAIVISRIYSALLATLLIPLLFSLGKKLKDETVGLLSAFFATMSVGFIQFAHFGTFEMWLTIGGALLFWSSLKIFEKRTGAHIFLLSLIFGMLVATKVSSLVLLPIPLFALIAHSFQKHATKVKSESEPLLRQTDIRSLLLFLRNVFFFIFVTTAVYIITNPYVFLAQKDFLSSMNYESSVALGTLPVFYTGIFYDTVPGIYQFLHVYPFLLNPFMTIIFILSFIFIGIQTVKTRNLPYLLLITFYILLFSQAFFFVKWTRYMMPTLPFMILAAALFLASFLHKKKKKITYVGISVLLIISSIFALSYFKTAFINPDTRIEAVLFAQHTIPVDASILSEPADLGVMPFQDAFPHVDTFNFYEFDNHSLTETAALLQQKVATAQYIILPSQRILQSRIENPTRFPKGHLFYQELLNGTLGFHKIYETPCDIFCQITYLGDPIYWWEQTASVFDRPTVFIFKKTS